VVTILHIELGRISKKIRLGTKFEQKHQIWFSKLSQILQLNSNATIKIKFWCTKYIIKVEFGQIWAKNLSNGDKMTVLLQKTIFNTGNAFFLQVILIKRLLESYNVFLISFNLNFMFGQPNLTKFGQNQIQIRNCSSKFENSKFGWIRMNSSELITHSILVANISEPNHF